MSYAGRKIQGPGRRPKALRKKSPVVNYGHGDSSRNLNNDIHSTFSPTGPTAIESDTSPTPFSISGTSGRSLGTHNNNNNNTSANSSNSSMSNSHSPNNSPSLNTSRSVGPPSRDSDLIIKDEKLRKPSEIKKMNRTNPPPRWSSKAQSVTIGASYTRNVSVSNNNNRSRISNAHRPLPRSPPPSTGLPHRGAPPPPPRPHSQTLASQSSTNHQHSPHITHSHSNHNHLQQQHQQHDQSSSRGHTNTAIDTWSLGGRRDRSLAIRLNSNVSTSTNHNNTPNSNNHNLNSPESSTLTTFSPASQSSSDNNNNTPMSVQSNSNKKTTYASVAASVTHGHGLHNHSNHSSSHNKYGLGMHDSVNSVNTLNSENNSKISRENRKYTSSSGSSKNSYLSKPPIGHGSMGSSHGNIGSSSGSSSGSYRKEHQVMGEILMHYDSWQQLLTGKSNGRSTRRWKSVFAVLEDHSVRFWEQGARASQASDITIFLSEIVGINKSIRTIDNEKHIVDIDMCGSKCHLAFQNHELREFWYGKLNNHYWDYFMWRSAPLDPKHRRSQNTVIGFHKVITNQNLTVEEAAGVEYVDEVLHKVNVLPKDVYNRVPPDCVAQARRFQRALMAVRYFLMSALKSVSGADVPLPSLENLTEFLNEIQLFKWEQATVESLDYLTDRLYRLQINLSFALTAVCRDEIMRCREYMSNNANNNNNNNNNSMNNHMDMNSMSSLSPNDKKMLTELKYEYECLQRSWKMHRERLQEYVAAYGDAVARLKYSYHKRDMLCKKIEQLMSDKKELETSHSQLKMSHSQLKTSHSQYEQQLRKLTETLPLLYNTLNGGVSGSNSAINRSNAAGSSSAPAANVHVGSVSPLPTKMVIDIPQPTLKDFQLNNNNRGKRQSSTVSSTHSHSHSHSKQSERETHKQLRIQKLSLDLIRLKAEQETYQLLHPNDPKPAYMNVQIKKLQDQISALQNNETTIDENEPHTVNSRRNSKNNNDNNNNNNVSINIGNNNQTSIANRKSNSRSHSKNNNMDVDDAIHHHERQVSKQTQLVGLLEQQVKSLMNMAEKSQTQTNYSRQQHWDFM